MGTETRFAVLDTDVDGKYHNAQELEKLKRNLAGVSLAATLYQSSESNGWHCYLFFDLWQNSTEVQETLRAWLIANGYEIRGGQLEIFPSGNGLRLPLQSGFAWLDDQGNVLDRRKDLTTVCGIDPCYEKRSIEYTTRPSQIFNINARHIRYRHHGQCGTAHTTSTVYGTNTTYGARPRNGYYIL